MKNHIKAWFLLSIIVLVSLACSGGANFNELLSEAGSVVEETIRAAIEEAIAEYGIDIPTEKIREIEFSDGDLNMLIEAEFDAMTALMKASALNGGLTEQEPNTEITDTTATMIFDGHDSGLATVIQLFDEGDGLVRVKIFLQK